MPTQPFNSEKPMNRNKDFSTYLLVPWIKNYLNSFEIVFLSIFSRHNLLCRSYCFSYGATNTARKNIRKTTFHSTFEIIRLKPIRKKENNRKTFEETSVEPTIHSLYIYHFSTVNTVTKIR